MKGSLLSVDMVTGREGWEGWPSIIESSGDEKEGLEKLGGRLEPEAKAE